MVLLVNDDACLRVDSARIQDHYIYDRDAHRKVNGPVWHPTPSNTLGVGSGRTALWWIRGRTALWWILGGPTAFTPATEVETWRRPAGTGPTGSGGSVTVRELAGGRKAAVPHTGAWRSPFVNWIFMPNTEAMGTAIARHVSAIALRPRSRTSYRASAIASPAADVYGT